jgi:hypothetical protein
MGEAAHKVQRKTLQLKVSEPPRAYDEQRDKLRGARSYVWANLVVRGECCVSSWTEVQFLLASTLFKVGHLDSPGALRRHGTN